MVELVRPGGSLIVTCAGPGRPPHCMETAPNGHYANVSITDLLVAILNVHGSWADIAAEYDGRMFDTRAILAGRR